MFSSNGPFDNDFARSLKKTTTARIGIGHCGGRYPTKAQLGFQEDFAAAKDSVQRETPDTTLDRLGFAKVTTVAKSREDYFRNTSSGRMLDEPSILQLQSLMKAPDIQIIAADGLSAEAFEHNVPEMLPLLESRLRDDGLSVGSRLFVRRARVAVMDHVGEILKPKASLILIGERPGLGICDSLSGYFEFHPGFHRVESDRNVLSNIHSRGVPPPEAALMLAEALIRVLELSQSGMHVRFDFH